MHLHGPYICQYGILLNYPPFSEYDYVIKDIQSKFDEVVSVEKATKSKPSKDRVAIDDKGKMAIYKNILTAIPEDTETQQEDGDSTFPRTAKVS